MIARQVARSASSLLVKQRPPLSHPVACRVRNFAGLHHSQKSEGEVASRHASVLTAKTPEDLALAYDKWAEKYDEDLEKIVGAGGVNVAAFCCMRPLLKYANPVARPTLIDVGCGTGYTGIKFHEAGWRDFFGFDLSFGMLKKARETKVYGALVQGCLPDSGLPSGAFDVVHSAGMFAPGQAPPSSFDEFHRILKPGGLAIFSIREHYYDSEEGTAHKDHLEKLVAEGAWKQIDRTLEEYIPGDNVKAYVFVMEKPAH